MRHRVYRRDAHIRARSAHLPAARLQAPKREWCPINEAVVDYVVFDCSEAFRLAVSLGLLRAKIPSTLRFRGFGVVVDIPNGELETELGSFCAATADRTTFLGGCAYYEVENVSSTQGAQERPRFASDEALRAASIIWNEARALFERHADRWRLFARVGSTQSDFSEIPLDIWRHYRVIDWPRGVAAADSGEMLYSVHVDRPGGRYGSARDAPSEQAATDIGTSTTQSTAAKELLCFKFLAEQMRSNLRDPLAKESAWSEASTRFPGLSGKAFNRAWARAIEETGASDWKMPGRRKRK